MNDRQWYALLYQVFGKLVYCHLSILLFVICKNKKHWKINKMHKQIINLQTRFIWMLIAKRGKIRYDANVLVADIDALMLHIQTTATHHESIGIQLCNVNHLKQSVKRMLIS